MRRRTFLHQFAGSLAAVPWVSNVAAAAPGNSNAALEDNTQTSRRAGDPVLVNSARQLFIDNSLIAEGRGVRLVVNRPEPTGERCVVPGTPWDSRGIEIFNSVMDDEGVLKLWYWSLDSDYASRCCYATSRDGIHWEKPNLGIIPFQGQNNTNIVFPPSDVVVTTTDTSRFELNCVFKDTNPACTPSERYKLVCSLSSSAKNKKNGTYVAGSADGLHWKLLTEEPVFRASDTGNICFFDRSIGRYVAYVRVWDPMRKVGRCEFNNLADWGKEQVVFTYDAEDERGLDNEIFYTSVFPQGASANGPKNAMDFYNSAAVKYPRADNVYLMFPSAYYHYREDWARRLGAEYPDNDGILDIQFATSRDGKTWNRLDRHPFIPLGVSGGFDTALAYMASGIVLRPEEMWFYYYVADHTHGNRLRKEHNFIGAITRARMRLDGVVSVDAEYTGGEFTTPSMQFSGDHLTLNTRTSAGGHVRVELQDESSQPLPGFSADECDPINGDFIEKVVSWRGNPAVQAWAGKPVRARFVMRDAKLYSFKFD